MLRNLALAVLPAVVSCGDLGPDAQSFRLQTDQSRYGPGSVVRLTLTNVGGQAQPYSACTQVLEQRLHAWWVVHPRSPGNVPCLDVLLVLDPGESAILQLQLPSTTATGEYRWRLPEAREAISNDFEIAAPLTKS